MERPILMKQHLSFENPVHEVVPGKRAMLSGALYHDCWTNMDAWVDDIKRYSYLKALKWSRQKKRRSFLYWTSRQFAAAGYFFFKRFFIEKRYKQGIIGFIYCFTWSFEEFLTVLKYYEIMNKKKNP